MPEAQDVKMAALAREIRKIEAGSLTAKLELSWKTGKLVAVSYTKLPIID